jgi:hypothetical protein
VTTACPAATIEHAVRMLDPHRAAQHQRHLVELGPLERLRSTRRRHHVRHRDGLLAAVDPAHVLVDDLATGYRDAGRG